MIWLFRKKCGDKKSNVTYFGREWVPKSIFHLVRGGKAGQIGSSLLNRFKEGGGGLKVVYESNFKLLDPNLNPMVVLAECVYNFHVSPAG